ncbi:hypothetical protein Slin14017_G127050 [Septoria linicola]|nr:hypothetical protein Slin14017_G127050 [Septoria linicola]
MLSLPSCWISHSQLRTKPTDIPTSTIRTRLVSSPTPRVSAKANSSPPPPPSQAINQFPTQQVLSQTQSPYQYTSTLSAQSTVSDKAGQYFLVDEREEGSEYPEYVNYEEQKEE